MGRIGSAFPDTHHHAMARTRVLQSVPQAPQGLAQRLVKGRIITYVESLPYAKVHEHPGISANLIYPLP